MFELTFHEWKNSKHGNILSCKPDKRPFYRNLKQESQPGQTIQNFTFVEHIFAKYEIYSQNIKHAQRFTFKVALP